MADREARRQFRQRQKIYHSTITSLEKSHKRLFDPRGWQSVVTRSLGHRDSTFVLAEGQIRLLSVDDRLPELASQFFLTFAEQFGASKKAPVQVTIEK